MNARLTIRQHLRKKWQWSPWRIFPIPVLCFVITGGYYWFIGFDDAWRRGVVPALTLMTFIITRPIINHWWFAREREKMGLIDEKRSKEEEEEE